MSSVVSALVVAVGSWSFRSTAVSAAGAGSSS
jgi:hypothetical protein